MQAQPSPPSHGTSSSHRLLRAGNKASSSNSPQTTSTTAGNASSKLQFVELQTSEDDLPVLDATVQHADSLETAQRPQAQLGVSEQQGGDLRQQQVLAEPDAGQPPEQVPQQPSPNLSPTTQINDPPAAPPDTSQQDAPEQNSGLYDRTATIVVPAVVVPAVVVAIAAVVVLRAWSRRQAVKAMALGVIAAEVGPCPVGPAVDKGSQGVGSQVIGKQPAGTRDGAREGCGQPQLPSSTQQGEGGQVVIALMPSR